MSLSAKPINQSTYTFVQTIATKFDQKQCPQTQIPSLILDSSKDGFKMEVEESASSKKIQAFVGSKIRHQIATQLPPEIAGLIGSYTDNFSQWAVMNGLADPRINMPQSALDASAADFLGRMNVKRNDQSASDQLKTHVFEKVFASSSEEEQLKLIEQMQSCTSITESYSFRIRFMIFKVQSTVAGFFSNPIIVIIVSVIVAWQARKAYLLAHAFFDHQVRGYYIPKAVNHFINVAPPIAIRVTSIFIASVTSIANNPFKIIVVSAVFVNFSGPLRPYAVRVQNILLLPITLPRKFIINPISFYWKAITTSLALQIKLSRISKKGSDQTKNRLITENTIKAYQLWMYLMNHPKMLYKG